MYYVRLVTFTGLYNLPVVDYSTNGYLPETPGTHGTDITRLPYLCCIHGKYYYLHWYNFQQQMYWREVLPHIWLKKIYTFWYISS